MSRNNELHHFSAAGLAESQGFVVYKDVNMATASPINMFNVRGKVMLNLIHGEVTTVIATTTTFKFRRETGTVDLCTATTITTDAVGTMYLWSGDQGAILNNVAAGTDIPVVGFATLNGGALGSTVFGLSNTSEVIEGVTDAPGTGVIRWWCHWIPLESGARVTAA